MNTRKKIKLVTRKTDVAGKFQTELEPACTLAGKTLVKRWAAYSNMNTAHAQAMLTLMEGFILDELCDGNRLDFGLVSFYPRLSGAISSRDASPETDGCYVRGAVKARRTLTNGLKDKLEAENSLCTVHSRIFNVFDKTLGRFDVIAAGHVLSVAGIDIPVDETREDEGVWLEKRTHDGYVRTVRGKVLKVETDFTEIIFDEPVVRGAYMLAFYTRCGHGSDYRVVRISHKVRAVQADHITPWAKGGKTVAENCQMLCADCNRRKSDV